MAQAAVQYLAAIGVKATLTIPTTFPEFSADAATKAYSLCAGPIWGGLTLNPIYGYGIRYGPLTGSQWGDQHGWTDSLMARLQLRGMRAGAVGSPAYDRIVREMILRAESQAEFVPILSEDWLTYYNPKLVKGVKRPDEWSFELVDWSPTK
jgi:hypothetical protein